MAPRRIVRRGSRGRRLQPQTLDGDDRLLRNHLTGNFDEGIFATASSSGTQILDNQISGSGIRSRAPWADGIDARGDRTLVRGNTVVNNHDDGIDVGGRGDTVDGNRIDRSVHDGIDVDGNTVLVQNNYSTRNGDDGIGVGREGGNVTIRNNITNFNTDLGIQPIAGTAIDGGGNRASGNGDARQCVQVVCTP